MAKKRKRGERIPVEPLRRWFEGKRHGAKADFARNIGLEQQAALTNWLARGSLPADRLRAVCVGMKITETEYRKQAGIQIEAEDLTASSIKEVTTADIVRKLDQMLELLRDLTQKVSSPQLLAYKHKEK